MVLVIDVSSRFSWISKYCYCTFLHYLLWFSLRPVWVWSGSGVQICHPFLLVLGVSVGSQVRKGDSIAEFLRAVQHQLAAEFREIRTASVENLLYVKEDLIIPHVSVNSSIFLLSFHSQLARPWVQPNIVTLCCFWNMRNRMQDFIQLFALSFEQIMLYSSTPTIDFWWSQWGVACYCHPWWSWSDTLRVTH